MNFRDLIDELNSAIEDIEASCSWVGVATDQYGIGSAINSIRYVIKELHKAAPKCQTCGRCHELWRAYLPQVTGIRFQETDGRWSAEMVGMPGVLQYGNTLEEARDKVICLGIAVQKGQS